MNKIITTNRALLDSVSCHMADLTAFRTGTMVDISRNLKEPNYGGPDNHV